MLVPDAPLRNRCAPLYDVTVDKVFCETTSLYTMDIDTEKHDRDNLGR
jgi:hypothetical protein